MNRNSNLNNIVKGYSLAKPASRNDDATYKKNHQLYPLEKQHDGCQFMYGHVFHVFYPIMSL